MSKTFGETYRSGSNALAIVHGLPGWPYFRYVNPAPASVLESLMESFLGIPAQIEQFLPTWFAIGESPVGTRAPVMDVPAPEMVIAASSSVACRRIAATSIAFVGV